jgi:hypothetical protein
MANPIHGRRGRLYAGIASDTAAAEPITNLKSWSISFTVDKVDTTCFGDSNKKYASGLPDAQGAFDGYYDTASAQLYTASQDGLARRFYLYPDTSDGDYFFGTALFDFGAGGAVDAAVSASGTWAAASAIAKVSA